MGSANEYFRLCREEREVEDELETAKKNNDLSAVDRLTKYIKHIEEEKEICKLEREINFNAVTIREFEKFMRKELPRLDSMLMCHAIRVMEEDTKEAQKKIEKIKQEIKEG